MRLSTGRQPWTTHPFRAAVEQTALPSRGLKAEHSALTVILNGGLSTLRLACDALGMLDGVMIDRATYHTPCMRVVR